MTIDLKHALAHASAPVRAHLDRIEAELRFAAGLCDLHPDQAAAWKGLIDRARRQVADRLAIGPLETVVEAVGEAEALLAPIGKVAKKYTVHCAGHGHIDMNWMWSWPETVSVTIDTFITVLKLMEEFPEFCYSQSQASVYRIIEEHRPDLLKAIARRVKEGRWEVTASHWVEGDKNLAGGESLCRHVLYTRQYMKKLLKLEPEDVPVDWSPDTFGHAATVPTYLAQAAVKYLYMHRPGAHGPARPWLFWWQAPDGARLLVRNDSRSTYAYNGIINPEVVGGDLLRFAGETGLRDHLFIYGVGDHGGGPTRSDLRRVLELATWPIFPNVRFSRVQGYLDLVAKQAGKLPVLDCELNFEFAGCYTTQTLIKKANRFGESRLVDAEFAASMAWLAAGLPYPGERLQAAWRDVLFSHFHDILPGSGVRDTRTYTHGLYQQVAAAAASIETQSLRELAARVDTSRTCARPGDDMEHNSLGSGVGFRTADGALPQSDQSVGEGDRPFVVFNPTAADRAEVVEATVWASGREGLPAPASRKYAVRGGDGSAVPAQVVASGGFWGHNYAVVAFPARVAGLGWAQYTVAEDDGGAAPANLPQARQLGRIHPCRYSMVERSPEGLENDLVSLELDPTTGGIRHLLDRTTGAAVIHCHSPEPLLEYLVERPHGMTAWLVQHQGAPSEYPQLKELRRGQDGPHKATLEARYRLRESEFTLVYELRAGDPQVYLHLAGTWFERGGPEVGVPTLNLRVPLDLTGARGRYEIPFGAIDRDLDQREEVPALQWAQVTGTHGEAKTGLLLVNDCKHGHSLEGSVLRLTLIRSSYDPDPLPEIGHHEAHLALRPFGGELSLLEAIDRGNALNHPLKVVSTDWHEGALPGTGQFLKVGPGSVCLSGLKKAEDGDALVVRLYNPTRRKVTAKVGVALKGRAVAGAQTVDLMERSAKGGRPKRTASGVSAEVGANGLSTLMVEVKEG
ncbi:MAG: glycoside hydrolase family 38 C-terminal domain-containing protein [Gemmatimonadota bacterium]